MKTKLTAVPTTHDRPLSDELEALVENTLGGGMCGIAIGALYSLAEDLLIFQQAMIGNRSSEALHISDEDMEAAVIRLAFRAKAAADLERLVNRIRGKETLGVK